MKQGPRPSEAPSKIRIGFAPRLAQAAQVRQLSTTRIGGGQFLSDLTALLPKDVQMTRERGQDVKVALTFGHEAGMKGACG